MKALRTEIEIHAPPERVWQVLTDFAAYPEWNPFIRSIEGEPKVGARLSVRIEPPGARGMTFKPTVRGAEPLGDGRSKFSQCERFSGLLVGLLGKTLTATEQGFEQMNEALRRRVEAA